MSQPSSFTTYIRMTDQAYARLLRAKTLDPLAASIARIVTDGLSDAVMFKYLKEEQALFIHYWFSYHERLDDIIENPDITTILNIAAFKDIAAPDRAAISLDAPNFKISGPAAGFVIEPDGFRRDDTFDGAEIERFDTLINKYFFKLSERFATGDALWHTNSKVLDRKLWRKVERHLEAHRLNLTRERLPNATPLQPVRLCNHFHYNGHFVLFAWQTLHPLPQLDASTFRQTTYGAADARHVVVGHRVLRTDPAQFKVLNLGETIFYKDAERVYNADLKPVPDADPKTFKLVHGAFARDSKRWYDSSGFPLDDVGDRATIDDRLHFHGLCLLWGERSIYLGSHRLPIDAASCRLIQAEKNDWQAPFKGVVWLRDKDGDCIVSLLFVPDGKPRFEVKRTTAPERLWDEETASQPASSAAPSPTRALRDAMRERADDVPAREAFVAFFDQWLAAHFEHYWREAPLDSELWQGINNYFYCCWHLGQFQKIIDLYARVETEAWVKPFVFHHTACAYVAVGALDRAVEEIRRGLVYGYARADEFFTDPDLARLAGRDDFERLKAAALALFDGSRPRRKRWPVPGELLRHVLNEVPERLRPHHVRTILTNYIVPEGELRAQWRVADGFDPAAYEQALAAFFNHIALNDRFNTRDSDIYKTYPAWGDLPGIHPAAHLVAALSFYIEGFFWVNQSPDLSTDRSEFLWAALAFQRAKAAVALEEKWTGDPVWQAMSADPTVAPFLALY